MIRGGIMEVSDLNEYVSLSLARDPVLTNVRLRGEIGSLKRYPSGHLYFSLKDDRCQIAAVMWKSDAQRLSFRPENGMSVIVTGRVTIYAEAGRYQLVCAQMRPEGLGALYIRYEELKEKLRAEGLFDAERKRPLPYRARRIAVVTAESGAVIHDICRVAGQRDPGLSIVLLPVPVQGAGAGEAIARAVRHAGEMPDVEALIVGRGGGSMEDLWCFNEECVVRAVAACPVPVVSAVGHQTDFTLCDFAADVRAATPSNAAELITQHGTAQIAEALAQLRMRMDDCADDALYGAELHLNRLRRRLQQVSPEARLNELRLQAGRLRFRMRSAAEALLPQRASRAAVLRLRLDAAMDRQTERAANRLRHAAVRLKAADPDSLLDRGYARVSDGETVIGSAAEAEKHARMTLTFRDGQVRVLRENENA